jgi:hypothetical protein
MRESWVKLPDPSVICSETGLIQEKAIKFGEKYNE